MTDSRVGARRDHTQTAFEAEIEAEGCPSCGGDNYVITDGERKTRVDHAWWEGYCKDCGYED